MPIILDARTAIDHFPGIGRYVANLARALAHVAPDLDLTLLRDPRAISTRQNLPELPQVACAVSPFSIRQQWMVPGLLRRAKATLYHSPYYLMPYATGAPTVLTCYDVIPLAYPEYFTAAQRMIYRLAHGLAMTAAQVILAISEFTKSDLVRHFHTDPRKIVVTPLAADPHMRPRPPHEIASVRRRYGLPGEYALYLASNKPHKNLPRLVQAWDMVCKQLAAGPNLVIAGHWDERYPQAKQLVQDKGLENQVQFLGPVSEADLPALYSGAMLFIFPSLYEGFGLPVVEAMACGTPVACSQAASLPEAAGSAAALFDPREVEAIASAITRIVTDPELRRRLRHMGLEQSAHMTWAGVAETTARVYRQVCRRPSPPPDRTGGHG